MRSSRTRGLALVLTLMSLLFIGVLLSTILSVATSGHRGMVSRYTAIRAYYLAREGLSRAMAELGGNPSYAVATPVTATLANDAQGRTQGSYTVRVVSSGNTPGNALRAWVVTSTGNFGTAVRTIRAWVGQESFSNFMYFSNQEMPDNYWITGNTLRGPVHTNGHYNFSGTPAFSDQATSSNADEAASPARRGYPFDNVAITYNPNFITGNDAPHSTLPIFTDPSRFYHAYDGNYTVSKPIATANATGFSFTGGQPTVQMPTSNATTAAQATTTFTRDATLEFSVAGGRGRVKITTTNSQGHQTVTNRDVTNPDVFSATNANLYVKGTVHGNVTVTASGNSPTTSDPYDVDTYKIENVSGYGRGNVFITGDIAYYNPTSDIFGIVAQNNVVVKPTNTNSSINLVGSYMAIKGIFMADHFWTQSYNNRQLTLTGGLISLSQTLMGTFNTHNNRIVTGYNENYVFDTRLLTTPPPAFPVTGRVNLKGLVDTGALGSI